MEYDKETVNALLEIQKYQCQLKKILDNDMHDLRSVSKPNNLVSDNSYEEESIYYKRLFFCYLVISITGFIVFYLHITKEHYKELAMIQGVFIDSHNKVLDMIIENINRFRVGLYPLL